MMIIAIMYYQVYDQNFPGEYCSTPGAFLIDIERILALLPMEELMTPKPDLQKLMAVMPNFEDFEDLIIRRLECGGRGTVSGLKMVLTQISVAQQICYCVNSTKSNYNTNDDHEPFHL